MEQSYKKRYEEDGARFRNVIWVMIRLKVVDITWYTEAMTRYDNGTPAW